MIVIIYYPDSTTHLALALTGLNDKNIYISFFPPYSGTGTGFRLTGIAKDKQHVASEVIILPSEESCGFGLSEQAIYDWWKNEFNKTNRIERFEWFTNNCSSVVYRALLEGQKGAQTMKYKIILERESGISTPKKICSYAIKLHDLLISNPNPDNEITLKHNELKQCCLLGIDAPYNQATAVYWRLKSFNTNTYSLTLQKPFCDGIMSVLNKLQEYLPDFDYNIKDQDLNDIEKLFNKISEIANYIYNTLYQLNPEFAKTVEDEMQNAIKHYILLPMITLLDEQNSSIYLEQKTKVANESKVLRENDLPKITIVLNDLVGQIDDKKNPHISYFKSDSVPIGTIHTYRAR